MGGDCFVWVWDTLGSGLLVGIWPVINSEIWALNQLPILLNILLCDNQYAWWSLNMIANMRNSQYVWKPIYVYDDPYMRGNHNASTPDRATHQRLRDLVRLGSGSWWPGTTQVIIMIRICGQNSRNIIGMVRMSLVCQHWIDVNEHHYI